MEEFLANLFPLLIFKFANTDLYCDEFKDLSETCDFEIAFSIISHFISTQSPAYSFANLIIDKNIGIPGFRNHVLQKWRISKKHYVGNSKNKEKLEWFKARQKVINSTKMDLFGNELEFEIIMQRQILPF